MMAIDTNTVVGRMRLLTGDYDSQYLSDEIYTYLYTSNGNSELDGAIEALESIINNLALSPTREVSGDIEAWGPSVAALQARLDSLKEKRNRRGLVPVLLKSDRKSWTDFDKIFDRDKDVYNN
jgi:ribonuclease HI